MFGSGFKNASSHSVSDSGVGGGGGGANEQGVLKQNPFLF